MPSFEGVIVKRFASGGRTMIGVLEAINELELLYL